MSQANGVDAISRESQHFIEILVDLHRQNKVTCDVKFAYSQNAATSEVHVGHGPTWHLIVQWCPHSNSLLHCWSHVGMGSVHSILGEFKRTESGVLNE